MQCRMQSSSSWNPRRDRGFSSGVWNLEAVHRPLHAIRNAPITIPALHELAARHKPSMRVGTRCWLTKPTAQLDRVQMAVAVSSILPLWRIKEAERRCYRGLRGRSSCGLPRYENVVLVLCTGGILPLPASHVFVLRHCVLSPDRANCVVSLDVVSWLGTAAVAVAVVAVSGSSGGLNCTLGIGPIKMVTRSLRTFNDLPRVTGVDSPKSQIMAFKESGVPTSSFPFCVSMHGFESMPFGAPINFSSVLLIAVC